VAVLESRAAQIYKDSIEAIRQELIEYCEPLCAKAESTELPPMRAINHTIPLIDENKLYPWRASKCQDAF
jgi:hypothetical protein